MLSPQMPTYPDCEGAANMGNSPSAEASFTTSRRSIVILPIISCTESSLAVTEGTAALAADAKMARQQKIEIIW